MTIRDGVSDDDIAFVRRKLGICYLIVALNTGLLIIILGKLLAGGSDG